MRDRAVSGIGDQHFDRPTSDGVHERVNALVLR
jgi:hypothetical protein